MSGNLKKIVEGDNAALVKSLVLPYLEVQRLRVLAEMEDKYLRGEMEPEWVWGKVGEIVGIKRLAAQLDKEIVRGWAEQEKEYK